MKRKNNAAPTPDLEIEIEKLAILKTDEIYFPDSSNNEVNNGENYNSLFTKLYTLYPKVNIRDLVEEKIVGLVKTKEFQQRIEEQRQQSAIIDREITEKRKRRSTLVNIFYLIIALPTVIFTLLLIYEYILKPIYPYVITTSFLIVTTVILGIIGFAALTFKYLTGKDTDYDKKIDSEIDAKNKELTELKIKEIFEKIAIKPSDKEAVEKTETDKINENSLENNLIKIEESIEDDNIDDLENEPIPIKKRDLYNYELKHQIDEAVEQRINTLSEKTAKNLERKYSAKVLDNSQLQSIRDNMKIISERLTKEIEVSGRRSNLNLIIGILTTVLAASLLAYIAFEIKPAITDITSLLAHYIPRITTIIFIEVFAFFFLRLYKSGLQEIKYFQNELTNIEMQLIAIEATLFQRHNKPLEGIIDQLIKTERNPVQRLISKEDSNLGIKDVGSILETVSKVAGGKT